MYATGYGGNEVLPEGRMQVREPDMNLVVVFVESPEFL